MRIDALQNGDAAAAEHPTPPLPIIDIHAQCSGLVDADTEFDPGVEQQSRQPVVASALREVGIEHARRETAQSAAGVIQQGVRGDARQACANAQPGYGGRLPIASAALAGTRRR